MIYTSKIPNESSVLGDKIVDFSKYADVLNSQKREDRRSSLEDFYRALNSLGYSYLQGKKNELSDEDYKRKRAIEDWLMSQYGMDISSLGGDDVPVEE